MDRRRKTGWIAWTLGVTNYSGSEKEEVEEVGCVTCYDVRSGKEKKERITGLQSGEGRMKALVDRREHATGGTHSCWNEQEKWWEGMVTETENDGSRYGKAQGIWRVKAMEVLSLSFSSSFLIDDQVFPMEASSNGWLRQGFFFFFFFFFSYFASFSFVHVRACQHHELLAWGSGSTAAVVFGLR